MIREDVVRIVQMIMFTFPNFDCKDISKTIDAWEFFLGGYSYEEIGEALKIYVATGDNAFPPNPSQLIAMVSKTKELSEMNESEAWSIVRKAIARGNYYSEEDFNKFSPEIQKAVGSASQLRIWASDEDFNEGVESSNFKRAYLTIMKRKSEMNRMPSNIKDRLGTIEHLALELEGDNND